MTPLSLPHSRNMENQREAAQGQRESQQVRQVVDQRLQAGRALLLDEPTPVIVDQPVTHAHRQMASQIILAGRLRRGEIEPEATLPTPATGEDHQRRKVADAIIRAGMQARGEIPTDELPPGAVDAGDAQRRATADQIIFAGKKRRGEVS